MQNRINKWIVLGWMFFLVSLFIPWTAKPFGGTLGGWYWIVMDFFPFFYLVSFTEVKVEHISAYLLSLSVIIMLASPLLLYLLNRTYNKLHANIILLGFFLALGAFFFEFFQPKEIPPPDSVIGYLTYVCAYAMLAAGFIKHAFYVQSN